VEVDAATLACSAAAGDCTVAEFAAAAAKAGLNTAVATHNAALDRESNAKARFSSAIKRHHTAWDNYHKLLSSTHTDVRSSPAWTDLGSPKAGGKGDADVSCSDTEDMNGEIFEGILAGQGDRGEFGTEMDVA